MTTSYTDISAIFESRKGNPRYNTSYPLSPDDWSKFIKSGELAFDKDRPIAFYLHIPFCRQICSFCEYTRICIPSEARQIRYVNTLISDLRRFVNSFSNLVLFGFDIGGGTPTVLCDSAFHKLLSEYSHTINLLGTTDDFEPSIEATFQTLSYAKIRMIANAGIPRISLGLQSSSNKVMSSLHRQNEDVNQMLSKMSKIHDSGIRKVNLDLMYGLPRQTEETICLDLDTISLLLPEQVTVYELRINQLGNRFASDNERNYQQYSQLFDGLTSMGYYAQFGHNTFSKSPDDFGVSSYLRHRMLDGWQYKGFGISAQSMSSEGLAYNVGKNESANILRIIDDADSFETGIYYQLSKDELLAKYIAISGYSGGFNLSAAKELFGPEFDSQYKQVIDFLTCERLVTINGDRLQFTKLGFRNYGAVLSLFYSHDFEI